MEIKDLERFNEFAEACGNRYLAVRCISKWSRQLGAEYKDCHLVESKLIEWVITGKCPYPQHILEGRRFVSNKDKLDDFLEWVSDPEVADEVKSLYKQSVRNKKLIYCNRKDFTLGQVSRTNVLLRMAWYTTTKAKGDS